mgnify:CR=1 FL=1
MFASFGSISLYFFKIFFVTATTKFPSTKFTIMSAPVFLPSSIKVTKLCSVLTKTLSTGFNSIL